MKLFLFSLIGLFPIAANTQAVKYWTEADRKYLIDHLVRTRDEMIRETSGLSRKQWSFHESPDRWSINGVVEHLALWQVVFGREISQALANAPIFTDPAYPDSTYYEFIMEEKPHVTVDFTKPFTFASPMEINDLQNNMAWFQKFINESITFIKSTDKDLRVHYQAPGEPNVHQAYIYVFGHVERGLRQIRKIKRHPGYPR